MSEEITRFDMDMDGSMEPSEHGRWVRYEDIAKPKREWVGLTDEEYLSLADQIDDATGIDLIEYGQAVIAKFEEKNGWSS